MREILFRGKRLDNGEWVEGSLHIERGETDKNGNSSLDYRILGMRGECDYVDPTTVGQYTGLKDKNGKKIFEGDVVRYSMREIGGKDSFATNPVIFAEGGFAVGCYFLNHWLWDGLDGNIRIDGIEVIGNIHDNPELLGGDTR